MVCMVDIGRFPKQTQISTNISIISEYMIRYDQYDKCKVCKVSIDELKCPRCILLHCFTPWHSLVGGASKVEGVGISEGGPRCCHQ